MCILGRIVDLVVPSSTANLGRVSGARKVALLVIEKWSIGGHGIVTPALVAIHNTGNGIVQLNTFFGAKVNCHGAGDLRSNLVVESMLSA